MEQIQVMGVRGLPLIHAGDNIAAMIGERMPMQDGDILCVASTIYSKAKGYTKCSLPSRPQPGQKGLQTLNGEDPRFVQAVLDASADIIMEHPFILSELSFGHIGVRAGVDQSNIEDGMVIFLPPDPMRAARELQDEIKNTVPGEGSESSLRTPAADHSVGGRPGMQSGGAVSPRYGTFAAIPICSGMCSR